MRSIDILMGLLLLFRWQSYNPWSAVVRLTNLRTQVSRGTVNTETRAEEINTCKTARLIDNSFLSRLFSEMEINYREKRAQLRLTVVPKVRAVGVAD